MTLLIPFYPKSISFKAWIIIADLTILFFQHTTEFWLVCFEKWKVMFFVSFKRWSFLCNKVEVLLCCCSVESKLFCFVQNMKHEIINSPHLWPEPDLVSWQLVFSVGNEYWISCFLWGQTTSQKCLCCKRKPTMSNFFYPRFHHFYELHYSAIPFSTNICCLIV